MTKEEFDNLDIENVGVIHIQHNIVYRVVEKHVKMKDSLNNWVDAVIYCNKDAKCNPNDCGIFVRDIKSFFKEFDILKLKN